VAAKIDIAVIGAGQAGLSSAFHLRRLGLEADKEFVIFDRSPGTGAPGNFAGPPRRGEVQAWVAVLEYHEAYEKAFELRIHHPVVASIVCDRGERLRIETDASLFSARGIVNAPGTWETPYILDYPGREF
jgi:cation diffusion facilitator CzcD-associated flavoprotein CzcO